MFSVCVTFTLVFRNSISYNRFWEARTNIADMISNLKDVALHAKNYSTVYGDALQRDKLTSFQQEVGRLLVIYLSLLLFSPVFRSLSPPFSPPLEPSAPPA